MFKSVTKYLIVFVLSIIFSLLFHEKLIQLKLIPKGFVKLIFPEKKIKPKIEKKGNNQNEIINANKLLSSQERPMTTIISGAKISTKLSLIKKLMSKSDNIILGGGILNTFLMAMNHEIGDSLVEKSFIEEARDILNSSEFDKIIMPIDVTVSSTPELDKPENKDISMVQSRDKILDIGEKTIDHYIKVIAGSSIIFWNGPLGYVEKSPFNKGTIKISQAIASSNAYSIVGGGDTIPIIESLNLQDEFSCLSTGGGSLLKFIEGEDLPILDKLGMYKL